MLEEQPLISVIVPVYGVEQSLNECVASIVEQTYRNLDIILVDDGSPDRCPEMCDQWSSKDARIRVIHQRNAGPSAARNVGLDASHGEYIGFVDPDDHIAADMYKTLLNNLLREHADVYPSLAPVWSARTERRTFPARRNATCAWTPCRPSNT